MPRVGNQRNRIIGRTRPAIHKVQQNIQRMHLNRTYTATNGPQIGPNLSPNSLEEILWARVRSGAGLRGNGEKCGSRNRERTQGFDLSRCNDCLFWFTDLSPDLYVSVITKRYRPLFAESRTEASRPSKNSSFTSSSSGRLLKYDCTADSCSASCLTVAGSKIL